MKMMLSSRRGHYLAKGSIFLIIIALIAGIGGCVSSPTEYDLTVSSTEGGDVITPGEGTFTYDEGRDADLGAEADEGHRFVNWTGDVDDIASVGDATTTITMNDDYSVTANFVAVYELTISSTEGGEVTTPARGFLTMTREQSSTWWQLLRLATSFSIGPGTWQTLPMSTMPQLPSP